MANGHPSSFLQKSRTHKGPFPKQQCAHTSCNIESLQPSIATACDLETFEVSGSRVGRAAKQEGPGCAANAQEWLAGGKTYFK